MNDNNSKTLIWDNIPEWAIIHWNMVLKRICFLPTKTKK